MNSNAAPCPFCGSNNIDPTGWANAKGDSGPQCLECGATADSIHHWNNREYLTDQITNAIDFAIRKGTCSTYSDWQNLVHNILTNSQLTGQ